MLDIRPVSDLRNNFADIEKTVAGGEPVILTKNGYGNMVVMSIETYSQLIKRAERIMDETDVYAESDSKRLSHEDVFGGIRKKNAKI